MTTTNEIAPGRVLHLTGEVVGIDRSDRRARLIEQVPGRPPRRIDGISIGAAEITGEQPHDGEMHPDGDELLYVISGAITVTLELSDGVREVEVDAGEAVVVPQGTWHQITMRRSGELIHITPGPNGESRRKR
jgi:mannose-6-phosphate isomerase-like protein (cupin superfamily)